MTTRLGRVAAAVDAALGADQPHHRAGHLGDRVVQVQLHHLGAGALAGVGHRQRDLPIARWVGPPLTTVRQPLVEMAMAGAELIVTLAAGERPVHRRIELATSLVVRQSTASPLRG
jgi:Periplasmic binding protein-like domain